MSEAKTVLSVQDLYVKFVTREREVHAVNGVTFDLKRGEVLSILGESGSGKASHLGQCKSFCRSVSQTLAVQ